jgi:hypothetical protein
VTTKEQLEQVEKAIDAVLKGAQDYEMGGKRINRANIFHLFNERERLERKLYQETNGDCTVAIFDRR